MVEDVVGSEDANRYAAMGVSLSGWIGQDRRLARGLHRKVTASTAGRKVVIATVFTPIDSLRTILGVTEAGPRLAEFKAAWRTGVQQYGDAKDAAILATVAGKDVSVNFSRAGEYGRIANEMFLFFNAGLQGMDKLGRTFWNHPARTVTRAGMWITAMAMANYFRNRDEEWWKELPPHEKWNHVHVKIPGTDVVLRLPLPFEFGALFGALPAAMIEESRSPGAFAEAWGIFTGNSTPDLIPAMIRPVMEVAANKDWKGKPIVPDQVREHRLPADQYSEHTTELAKIAGRATGSSPAMIEHLVDGYTGGFYRRLAKTLDAVADPTVATKFPRDWPVIGTLFLREGTSRVVGDFYERTTALKQKAGSGKATVEEIGELAAAESLSRSLSEEWKKLREISASGGSAKDRQEAGKPVLDSVKAGIKAHAEKSDSWRIRGAGKLAMDATNPDADASKRTAAAKLLQESDLSRDEAFTALRAEARRRGWKTVIRNQSGKLTPYGKRVARLRAAL